MESLVIRDALIVDGTGRPAYPGSARTEGDRIAAVWESGAGPAEGAATTVIQAAGKVLAPGFIDVHNHSDLSPFAEPWMPSYLRQGVTTVVVGNCGSSAAPPAGVPELAEITGLQPADVECSWDGFAGYLDRVDEARPALNVAALAGHGTIRRQIMGIEARDPTDEELRAMRQLAAEALEAGALGLSTGLCYAPGFHARTDEVVALAAELSRRGGVYATHVRTESDPALSGIREAFDIGRRAGVPVHISHLKAEGRSMWGRAQEVLAVIDVAKDEGIDVTADQYPYTAWETVLSALLPPWAPVEHLADVVRSSPERLRGAIEDGDGEWDSWLRGIGWERIVVSMHRRPEVVGRRMSELAGNAGEEPVETLIRLLIEDPGASMVGHGMREDDVETILARPDVLVGSNGTAASPEGALGRAAVHPRYYGTFPRVLGPAVRSGRLSLELGIRKMTLLAADRFSLAGRGRIAPGYAADLVIFDPARITDTATYEEPHRFPEGIDLVVVNGRIAWDGRERARAGRVLRRGG